jgi:hypothetical protein
MKIYVSDVLGIVGIVIGSVLTLIGLGLIVLIVLIKRKKREHNLELNENISTTQQKRETVVIESVQNTITSFDETNTNTTTFPTYQPGIHSSQINKQESKQIYFLSSSHTFDI